MRKIAKVDALFVEGPDDGALVNALIKRLTGVELAKRPYLVRTSDEGGGASRTMREFEDYIGEDQPDARIGLIVDRDEVLGRTYSFSVART